MAGLAGSLIAGLRSQTSQRRFHTLIVYFTGQGLAQLFSLSIGLLLLRWLDIDNYAQFSVAFAFQTTLSLLTDLGFSGTIVALVGPRGNDPDVIGGYIRSGWHLRNVMLLCMTPIAAIVYAGIARQHHWDFRSSVLLFLSIVASIYFSSMVSYFGAPLLIRGHLSHFYRHQLAGAIFRLGACAILYIAGGLCAWTTSWINALGFLLIGWLNMRESRPFARLPEHSIPDVTRQMVRYVLPNMPSLIFFALQGQISLFLISFFGHTQSIAEVGALGRLGQIFLLLGGFNGAVIEPFMARLPKERVLRNFLLIMAVAACVSGILCSIGFFEPNLLLLLLGPRYDGLQRETGWLVLASCMGYLMSVAWIMSSARRWIYWTTSFVTITLVFTTQIIFVAFFRVNSTMQVIYFAVATSAAYLVAVLFNSVFGFIRGPKIVIPDLDETAQIVERSVHLEEI